MPVPASFATTRRHPAAALVLAMALAASVRAAGKLVGAVRWDGSGRSWLAHGVRLLRRSAGLGVPSPRSGHHVDLHRPRGHRLRRLGPAVGRSDLPAVHDVLLRAGLRAHRRRDRVSGGSSWCSGSCSTSRPTRAAAASARSATARRSASARTASAAARPSRWCQAAWSLRRRSTSDCAASHTADEHALHPAAQPRLAARRFRAEEVGYDVGDVDAMAVRGGPPPVRSGCRRTGRAG